MGHVVPSSDGHKLVAPHSFTPAQIGAFFLAALAATQMHHLEPLAFLLLSVFMERHRDGHAHYLPCTSAGQQMLQVYAFEEATLADQWPSHSLVLLPRTLCIVHSLLLPSLPDKAYGAAGSFAMVVGCAR